MGEAKRRREHEKLVALAAYAAAAFELDKDGKRVAPSEFRLFHAGVNHTSKGDFVFDDIAAQLVMEAFTARNHSVPLMGDYEHQSLATPPIEAPASATQWVPEIRRDANGGPECWATQVQWADRARQRLESGEYRMYSPAFVPDDTGRIAALINFALTNLPASYDIAPLVAASEGAPEKDNEMEEQLKALTAKLTAAEEQLKALATKLAASEDGCAKMKALCLKKLGKSFDDWASEESDEHEDLKTLKSDVLKLTGKANVAEALGAVTLAVSQSQELVTLKQKIAADAAAALETEFTAMLDGAVAAGKISPAGGLVNKASILKLRAEAGTPIALSFLKGAIPADPIVQLRAPGEKPNDEVRLTPEMLEAAGRVGLAPTVLQQHIARQRGAGV
jgi:phage I-like protein